MFIDFLKNKIKGAPLGFVFDSDCFHSIGFENGRSGFAQNVAAHLGKAVLSDVAKVKPSRTEGYSHTLLLDPAFPYGNFPIYRPSNRF